MILPILYKLAANYLYADPLNNKTETKIIFPDPSQANKDGLLAVGGNLHIETLLQAYSKGIFPWYDKSSPILWWSPDPRMVLFPNEMKVSKSLKQIIKANKFECRFDTNFEKVIIKCSEVPRKDQGGTWITNEMIDAYNRLHEAGYAHSIETYYDKKLVGGLYGVSLGGSFFGESMFHTMANASKVALYHLVNHVMKWNFDLIDVQVPTEHLESLGAREITRKEFVNLLETSLKKPTRKGKWKFV